MADIQHTQLAMTDQARARYWAKVDKDGPLPDVTDPLVRAPQTPCWVWTASTSRAGYGSFVPVRGTTHLAHRIAYAEANGGIPEGTQVDHLCRRRNCVNPEHLEAVSQRENTLRGAGRGARAVAANMCSRGHEFNEANTYTDASGGRRCRECARVRDRARWNEGSPEYRAKTIAQKRARRAAKKGTSA